MNINYDVTDNQLLDFGLSARIIELARQPFMRKSNGKGFEMPDFDIPYAMSILDAKDNVSLASLAINNHGESVHFPPNDPYMGFVPHAVFKNKFYDRE